MAKYQILKAVEFDKTAAKFRKQYGSVQALVDSGHWMIQPKYDGCFVKIHLSPGGYYVRSRTDEPVRSMNHIGQALLEWFGDFAATGPVVVIGEAWHPTRSFPEISGAFRQHSPAPHLILMVNDIITQAEYEAGICIRPYEARYGGLPDCDSVFPVGILPSQDVLACARRFKEAGGYDGAILRARHAGWLAADAKNGEIVKVKPTLSLDLRVVDYGIERGAKTGRLVTTLVVIYNGVRTMVGSGVPHDLCGEDMLDRIVEIECLGVTEDGKLREPRYRGVRHDKVDTDG